MILTRPLGRIALIESYSYQVQIHFLNRQSTRYYVMQPLHKLHIGYQSISLTQPTCLVWVNSKTLCFCFFHNFNKDWTTISFPALFQQPYPPSFSSRTLGVLSRFASSCLNFHKEPASVVKSGWLQIFRNIIKPGKT